ncbi:MAG: acylneuraminate cytidylyltransferase family protein [Gammaproteobacteria bacterium]|nr:acylneuraminate cytidylyltransferase family protein [Gammaproteobacteria bacterium]
MKAHSERVPGKNFRALGHKPLYAWMLDTLLAIDAIAMVVINTDAAAELDDDPRLRQPRVLLRERSAALCGDFVSMNLIIGDDIAAVPADSYLMTHVTNPFLSAATIKRALAAYAAGLAAGSADSLFTVTRHQTRFYRADGSAINHDPANLIRTQDLEPWFEENSCMYLFSAASFARNQARIGDHPILFPIPKREAVDIDDQDDWNVATLLAAGMA